MGTKLHTYKRLRALGKTKLTFNEWILPKRLRGQKEAIAVNLISSISDPAIKDFLKAHLAA